MLWGVDWSHYIKSLSTIVSMLHCFTAIISNKISSYLPYVTVSQHLYPKLKFWLRPWCGTDLYRAMLCITAVLAVGRCPSVRPSVTCVAYSNGEIYRETLPYNSSFLPKRRYSRSLKPVQSVFDEFRNVNSSKNIYWGRKILDNLISFFHAHTHFYVTQNEQ